jgi:hypothetical protein
MIVLYLVYYNSWYNVILVGDSDGHVSMFERGKGTPIFLLGERKEDVPINSNNKGANSLQRRTFSPTIANSSGVPMMVSIYIYYD